MKLEQIRSQMDEIMATQSMILKILENMAQVLATLVAEERQQINNKKKEQQRAAVRL
jgi:hypothetical protein